MSLSELGGFLLECPASVRYNVATTKIRRFLLTSYITKFCVTICLLSCLNGAFAQDATTTAPADSTEQPLVASDDIIDPAAFAKAHDLAHANAYAQSLCHKDGFHCIDVPAGATWESLYPDFTTRETIKRLNRTNVALAYRNWLIVPDDISQLDYMALSPMPKHIPAKRRPFLQVDLSVFAFGAYNEKGDLIYWGPVSGGMAKCPEGPGSCLSAQGTHWIFKKGDSTCKSNTYPLATKGGAPMPYCMFYYKGFAIHSSTLSGLFNHSSGCIRLFYDDAMWLNQVFTTIGTEVNVKR